MPHFLSLSLPVVVLLPEPHLISLSHTLASNLLSFVLALCEIKASPSPQWCIHSGNSSLRNCCCCFYFEKSQLSSLSISFSPFPFDWSLIYFLSRPLLSSLFTHPVFFCILSLLKTLSSVRRLLLLVSFSPLRVSLCVYVFCVFSSFFSFFFSCYILVFALLPFLSRLSPHPDPIYFLPLITFPPKDYSLEKRWSERDEEGTEVNEFHQKITLSSRLSCLFLWWKISMSASFSLISFLSSPTHDLINIMWWEDDAKQRDQMRWHHVWSNVENRIPLMLLLLEREALHFHWFPLRHPIFSLLSCLSSLFLCPRNFETQFRIVLVPYFVSSHLQLHTV